MTSDSTFEMHFEQVEKWLAQGQTRDYIHQKLVEAGLVEEKASALVDSIVNERVSKHRQRGIILILVGSVLLVLGFLLTVFLFHANASIDLVMYGLTSVGILILLKGLVDIFGW